jgi:hypothetical protein
MKKNGIYMGEWEVDLVITEAGDLGITVYPSTVDAAVDILVDGPAVDIFIDKDLNIINWQELQTTRFPSY